MSDTLLETPDLALLLLQPPLQPRNLLPRHRKMERASQPRPQPSLAPGEVVVTLITSIHLMLVTLASSVHRMLGVTRGLSSPQPLLSVTSPGDSIVTKYSNFLNYSNSKVGIVPFSIRQVLGRFSKTEYIQYLVSNKFLKMNIRFQYLIEFHYLFVTTLPGESDH